MHAAWVKQQQEKQRAGYPAAYPAATRSGGHKFWAVVAFFILGVVFAVISMIIATGFELTDYAETIFFVALFIGMVIDYSIARRIWRGH